MYRFFAVFSRDSAAASVTVRSIANNLRSSSNKWQSIFNSAGLQVWHLAPKTRRLRAYPVADAGVILGTLFRARTGDESGAALPALTETDQARIRSTGGRALSEQYWGHYALFLTEPSGQLSVMTDPTGASVCYRVRAEGATVFFSHFEDLTELTAIRLTLNRDHLSACLQLHTFNAAETGFNEIAKLYPGECLRLTGERERSSFHWDPLALCTTDPIVDVNESIKSVRTAVSATVQSWASCYRRILHELSGGLDSAIVLACLTNAPSRPFIACCNYYTEAQEGDERQFARLVARNAGVELTESPIGNQPRHGIEEFVSAAGAASPLLASFTCEDDTRRPPIVAQHAAEAIFSGQGGDQCFHRTVQGSDAADYLWTRGLDARFFSVAMDTARVSHQSVWSVVRSAVRHGMFKRPYDVWAGLRTSSFIKETEVDSRQRCHPWLTAAAHELPPAKLVQLMCITETQTYYARECAYADEIYPLISQPVFETCLRIPCYVLSHGGMDRTVARLAFAPDLPEEIVARSSKGAVNDHFFKVIKDNMVFIRDFLCGGLLAAEGLIDVQALERTLLDPPQLAKGYYMVPIMTACKCEMWLRQARALMQRTAMRHVA
jgi:asparagine synthase (glutamine-hydrolysing)